MTNLPTWDDLKEDGYQDPHDAKDPTPNPDPTWDSDGDTAIPPLSNRDRARARNYRTPYERPKRKPAAERDEAFNAILWLVDGATGIVEELRHSDLGFSEDFWVHAAAARRETLLAARALIEQFIEATEADRQAQSSDQTPPRPRRGGITIE